jgi:hypothetical protein
LIRGGLGIAASEALGRGGNMKRRKSPQLSEKEWPDLDIPSSFCRALGIFEEEAAKIVNPRIKTYFTKLMTEGDPYCEIIFEEREE